MSRVKWKGPEAEKIAHKTAIRALVDGAEAILTEAIDQTPLLSGTLRRSATVTVGKVPDAASVFKAAVGGADHSREINNPTGDERKVFVSFNTPYALYQHERMDLKHKDGKPKFLEDPFNQLKDQIIKRVERKVKDALKKGV